MVTALWNPVRTALLLVGAGLARAGLVDRERVKRATELSWPRIVTGIARMSKSAADVAMVGIALGSAAIAGVGFASAFWRLVFAIGTGIAGGTIALVSQRYGADAHEELAVTVKVSSVVAVVVVLPLGALFHASPGALVGLIGSGEAAIDYGARYLAVVAVGVPFAAFNLVGSRTLVGADDAMTPMVVRAGGAVVNVVTNAVLIFGLGMGVEGAAIGTVLGNVVAAVAFGVGLTRGRLPLLGELPVRIPLRGPHFDAGLARQLGAVSTPLVVRLLAGAGGEFLVLAIVALFGSDIVAAFVVTMRVREVMTTPGWGFGLASSSLVGQALGTGDERAATAWARDVFRFAVAVYAVVAVVVFAFAGQVGRLFVSDPAILPLVTTFVGVTCVAVVFQGIAQGALGPLRASGDTRWPLYARLAGIYGTGVPLAYLGAVTPLGVRGLYLSIAAGGVVPAVLNYARYRTGRWRVVSRQYRPGVPTDD